MQHSESIKSIAKSLLRVQCQVGKVRKDGRGHNYVYPTLDHVIDVVRPLLTEAGIAVTQCMDQTGTGKDTLTTTLMDAESGEWIRSSYSLNAAGMKGVNDAQQMGAAITYARRYCLLAILNIAPGDDDDAQSIPNPGEQARIDKEAKLVVELRELASELGKLDKPLAGKIWNRHKSCEISTAQAIEEYAAALEVIESNKETVE